MTSEDLKYNAHIIWANFMFNYAVIISFSAPMAIYIHCIAKSSVIIFLNILFHVSQEKYIYIYGFENDIILSK